MSATCVFPVAAVSCQGHDVLSFTANHSVFGTRALGHLMLKTDPLSDLAGRLANQLNDGAQYKLANQLYSRLHQTGKLTQESLLPYASSFSEAHPDRSGNDRAIALVREARERIERNYGPGQENAEAVTAYAAAHRRFEIFPVKSARPIDRAR